MVTTQCPGKKSRDRRKSRVTGSLTQLCGLNIINEPVLIDGETCEHVHNRHTLFLSSKLGVKKIVLLVQ